MLGAQVENSKKKPINDNKFEESDEDL